ncbi:hypothetical protein [Streptomyces sp. NPDC058664]|uniref:hypothetical protein n=1 Tax=unclassified Streptomyces TaxID=2593676 RepID=UPI003655C86C
MTITVDICTDRPRQRAVGRVLSAGAVAAGVACLVGPRVAESMGLLVLVSAFEYRWPSFLVAVLLLGTAVRLLTERAAIRRRVLAVCAAAVIGTVWFLMVVFPMSSGGFEETDRKAAPGGADRYLVVEQGSAMIDLIWRVSVVDGSGLGAHHWRAGSFDEARGLVDVVWAGPDALRFTTVDGTVTTVGLDPRTGKPERELPAP